MTQANSAMGLTPSGPLSRPNGRRSSPTLDRSSKVGAPTAQVARTNAPVGSGLRATVSSQDAGHRRLLGNRHPNVLPGACEHFHAEHQGQHGKFDFDGRMIAGNITSKTALELIREWARLHRTELETNWSKMKAGRPLERIAPLE